MRRVGKEKSFFLCPLSSFTSLSYLYYYHIISNTVFYNSDTHKNSSSLDPWTHRLTFLRSLCCLRFLCVCVYFIKIPISNIFIVVVVVTKVRVLLFFRQENVMKMTFNIVFYSYFSILVVDTSLFCLFLLQTENMRQNTTNINFYAWQITVVLSLTLILVIKL